MQSIENAQAKAGGGAGAGPGPGGVSTYSIHVVSNLQISQDYSGDIPIVEGVLSEVIDHCPLHNIKPVDLTTNLERG